MEITIFPISCLKLPIRKRRTWLEIIIAWLHFAAKGVCFANDFHKKVCSITKKVHKQNKKKWYNFPFDYIIILIGFKWL